MREEKGRLGVLVGFIIVNRFEEDLDKEEYEFPKEYREVSVDIVQVEKDRRKELERWKNLTKILKRKQEKERTYAIGKSARAGV